MKLRQIIRSVATLAVVAMMTVAAWGQNVTRLGGYVVGEDGKPIEGAEVKIERTDIQASYSLKTDKNGQFLNATLPLGVYDVAVLVGGQQVYGKSGVRTSPSDPVSLDIDLAKVKAEAAAAAPASEEALAAARAQYEKEMKEYEDKEARNKALQAAFAAGNEAVKANNLDLAIESFEKAGALDPKQDAVWANLGDAYRRRGEGRPRAQRTEQQADYMKSAESFGKAIALKPEIASFHFDQSLALARGGKMDEAVAAVEAGAKLDKPAATRGYRNLGAVYFDTGNAEAAEAAFRKAIELDPRNPDAHFQLGLTLMGQVSEENGKLVAPAGTLDAFKKYLELSPNGVNAEEAKVMIETLGASVTNGVSQRKK